MYSGDEGEGPDEPKQATTIQGMAALTRVLLEGVDAGKDKSVRKRKRGLDASGENTRHKGLAWTPVQTHVSFLHGISMSSGEKTWHKGFTWTPAHILM
jgi:hypothetical protein